ATDSLIGLPEPRADRRRNHVQTQPLRARTLHRELPRVTGEQSERDSRDRGNVRGEESGHDPGRQAVWLAGLNECREHYDGGEGHKPANTGADAAKYESAERRENGPEHHAAR